MVRKMNNMNEIILLDIVLSGLRVLEAETSKVNDSLMSENKEHNQGITYGLRVAIEYVDRVRGDIVFNREKEFEMEMRKQNG